MGPVIRIFLQVAKPLPLILPIDIFGRFHGGYYSRTVNVWKVERRNGQRGWSFLARLLSSNLGKEIELFWFLLSHLRAVAERAKRVRKPMGYRENVLYGGGKEMQERGMEGATRCFPVLAARAHKNISDLQSMGGARSMRAVWKTPGHPAGSLRWEKWRDRPR